jgi:peptide/nickel transport system substrate-binding protein
MTSRRLGLIAACVSLALATPVAAQTLRWSSQGDVVSFDPNAQVDSFTSNIHHMVYDPLVRRNRKLEIEPALATSWQIMAPNRWRFTLRQGVKFQGGEPFTADDVVATVMRTIDPGSRNRENLSAVVSVEKVDDDTVDFVLKGPYPLLLNDLAGIFIMSKTWLAAHDALKPGNTPTAPVRSNSTATSPTPEPCSASTPLGGTSPSIISSASNSGRSARTRRASPPCCPASSI